MHIDELFNIARHFPSVLDTIAVSYRSSSQALEGSVSLREQDDLGDTSGRQLYRRLPFIVASIEVSAMFQQTADDTMQRQEVTDRFLVLKIKNIIYLNVAQDLKPFLKNVEKIKLERNHYSLKPCDTRYTN